MKCFIAVINMLKLMFLNDLFFRLGSGLGAFFRNAEKKQAAFFCVYERFSAQT